jgi:hypothetical protein
MNKIDKIHGLIYVDLLKCVYNLLCRFEYYKDVKRLDNSITAVAESPLSSELYQFFVFEEKLIGSVDVDMIINRINTQRKESLANSIYLVSKHPISKGFISTIETNLPEIRLNYIDRDKLISLIDSHYIDYWKHDDLALLNYEKYFCQLSSRESEIKKLKIFNDKYQKLLDIFIEPRIFHSYEDRSTHTPVRKRIEIEGLLKDGKNQLIAGEAGTGKSTLLRKIGERLILNNSSNDRKSIPVFISSTEIFENEFSIEALVKSKMEICFSEGVDVFSSGYNVVLLVDSIDELDNIKQKRIIRELIELSEEKKVRYIVGTRNHEKISTMFDTDGFNIYQVEKFNNEQVRKFVARFFTNDASKADELIESLKDNRIIERMPITPLTLSLISILYEENNLEIPATIADIYDNFNSLVIGRSTVTSRIQFIDISFKERILSLYALYILEKKDHTPLTKREFFTYFLEYYKGKTLPIKQGSLEEVLEYLIEHTGILVLKDDRWVKFSHDSYMEYYAALEIFKHQREKEADLVENFLEHNWQNAAIFYAGKSKDLPLFLTKVIERVRQVNKLHDCFSGVLGIGYLLQALFQTDNQLRKTAVLEALNMSVSSYETMLKLAADDFFLFKNYNLPIIQLMNLMYFYENFNSLTLKEPLKLAFGDVLESFRRSNNKIEGFKAVKLALTLDSKRISESGPLAELMEEKEVFKDPSLYVILDFSLGLLGSERYKSLKAEIKKDHFKNISKPVQHLLKFPASKLRFTNIDTLTNNKKVRIIVEGKTDAEIIEHAFYCLTNGSLPYWSIVSAGNESGGASELSKALQNAKPLMNDDSVIIGVFDHDAKGLQEFRGLKSNLFDVRVKDTLRKHVDREIYAICLPVPGSLDHYLQKDQPFNFLEIEHYFDLEVLKSQDILESSPLQDVYKIKDSRKKEFSKFVREQTDSKLFRNFHELFLLIDKIANVSIEYND